MANGDMQARLLLDSKDFDKKIDKSKKQVKGLGKEADKAGKKSGRFGKAIDGVGESLGKMISVAAIASAAVKTFQVGLASSQTLTDSWGRSVQALKALWEEFANSLLTWDWSVWDNGLDGIIDKAMTLYDVVDKLNNVQISASFVQKEQQSVAKAAQTDARNTELPADVRASRLAAAEQAVKEILQAAAIEEEETFKAIYGMIAAQNLPGDYPAHYIDKEDIINAIKYHASPAAKRVIGDYMQFPTMMGNINRRIEEKEAEMRGLEYYLYPQEYSVPNPKARFKVPIYVDPVLNFFSGTFGFRNPFEPEYLEKGTKPPQYIEDLRNNPMRDEIVKGMFFELKEILPASIERLKKVDRAEISPQAAGWALLEELTDEELKQVVGWYNAVIDMYNSANEIANTNQELRRAIRAAKDAEVALLNPSETDEMAGISFSNNVPEWRRWGENAIAQYYDATINPAADIPSTIKALDAQKMSNTLFDNELLKIAKENREALDGWAQGVGLLSDAFGRLGASIGGTTGEMLAFIGTILDATQQMLPLIAQIMAEKAARDANATSAATEAAAKTLSAHAGIPFAGVALGVAAVGAIIAAIQSVPKFAEGGIVNRATLGIFGEAGPEAVMPLDKLEEYVTPRELRVTGDIKASGKELKVVLDNYSRVRNG